MSETNHPIEEQADPRVHDPSQQEPQEALLPPVPVIPPELPEENQSNRAIPTEPGPMRARNCHMGNPC